MSQKKDRFRKILRNDAISKKKKEDIFPKIKNILPDINGFRVYKDEK